MISTRTPFRIWLNTDGLTGKRLAYVEANATAAQCTLEMLAATPLEVIYSPTFSSLAEAQVRHSAGRHPGLNARFVAAPGKN
ncbi:hypothetical protein LNP17_24725 [Klebsiella variicola subsp. variicola]|nr:hypothetical protein [Klebsiella variicola subsp. variicola]